MAAQTTAPMCEFARNASSDYLDGFLNEKCLAEFEAHLSVCPGCGHFVRDLRKSVLLLGQLVEIESTKEDEARAAAVYSEYFPEPELAEGVSDWTPVKVLWGELVTLTSREREALLAKDRQYLGSLLCDWLLARARRVSSVNPDSALPLAEAALQVARLRAEKYGDTERLISALEGVAWCLAVLGEFGPAAETLLELGSLVDLQGAESEARAGYLTTKGAYFLHVGQFDKSQTCLAEALELRRKSGNRRHVVCALVNIAGSSLSAGDHRTALRFYREAEALLRTESDPPRVCLAVYSNLMLGLCVARQVKEARELLAVVKDFAGIVGGWYSMTYTIWLEASLLKEETRYEEAKQSLELVRSEFLGRGHLVWYVEATLDLAGIHVRRNEVHRLDTLTVELEQEVEGFHGNDRVKAAVRSFGQAVRQQSLSGKVLSSIALALGSTRLTRRF